MPEEINQYDYQHDNIKQEIRERIGMSPPDIRGENIKTRVDNDFRFHPATPLTGPMHDTVREICRGAAHSLMAITPEGREQSLMLTKLEEVMFWANAGIARAK